MITLIVVVIGIISFTQLGLDLLPDIEFPVVSIVTSYPGAAPQEVETLLTKPIEAFVSSVNRVKNVTSISQEGFSIVMVEFEWGTNLDFAAQDIRDRLGLYRNFLPEDASDPLVVKFDVSQFPILAYGVTGPMEILELRDLIDDMVADRLERLDGVASAEVYASERREILVSVDRAALQARNLSINQVINALRAENLNLPAGYLTQGYREFILRSIGEYRSLEEIGNTIVGATREGRPIYLRDIATVRDTYKDLRSISRIQRRSGIILWITKRSGANTVITCDQVKKELKAIKPYLPPGIRFHIAFDQSYLIKRVVQRTAGNAIMGGILAIILIFFFLRNWRPTLTITLAIPLSIIATFIAFRAAGYTFNLLTLGGLALGVGMLVDNAVVVIENTFRHLEAGKDRKEAAKIGASEVGMAITASTLTTIAVFFPMIFVGGLPGKLSRGLALAVAFSLFASLFVALTIVPMLASVFFKAPPRSSESESSRSRRIFDRMRNFYKRILWKALERRLIVLLVVGLLFLLSLALIPIIGTEFMPQMDQNLLIMKVKMPVGTSLEETDRIVRQLEESILKEKYVQTVVATTGVNEEEPQNVAGGMGAAGPHEGSVMIRLVSRTRRDKRSPEILEDIRARLPKIKGAKFEALDMGSYMMTGGITYPIEIKVFGKDLRVLKSLAQQIAQNIQDVEGLRDLDISLSEGKPEWQIRINREEASRMGLPVAVVASAIQSSTLGKVATRFRSGGDEVDIRVRLREKDCQTIEDIAKIPIVTPLGKTIYLRQIADIVPGVGPIQIMRENQTRKVSVVANTAGRALGDIIRDIRKRIDPLKRYLPPGYFIEIGGQYEQMKEMIKWVIYAFALAILMVYMIMAAEFESFTHPFAIMFTIPLAIIGVFFSLLITGRTISLPALMGFIMLAGIAVNNGIVMVDYINQLRRRGMEVHQAVVEAAATRLRPILITALTTIFAMIPMALSTSEGAEMRSPMAITVIGGLFTTTFLTLFVVPAIYSLVDRISFKAAGKIKQILYGEGERATTSPEPEEGGS